MGSSDSLPRMVEQVFTTPSSQKRCGFLRSCQTVDLDITDISVDRPARVGNHDLSRSRLPEVKRVKEACADLNNAWSPWI